jgi:hypothetical protein
MSASPGLSEADLRYVAANDMLAACYLLMPKYQESNMTCLLVSLHFLMGFSTELYLKAGLLQSNMPSEEVFNFRHDLKELYKSAQTSCLLHFPHHDTLRRVVEILHPSHKLLSFRYLDPDVKVPYVERGISEALAVLKALDRYLRRNVSQRVGDRLPIAGQWV